MDWILDPDPGSRIQGGVKSLPFFFILFESLPYFFYLHPFFFSAMAETAVVTEKMAEKETSSVSVATGALTELVRSMVSVETTAPVTDSAARGQRAVVRAADKMAEETFCATLAIDSDMKMGMRVLAEPTFEGKKQHCKGTVMFIGELEASARTPTGGIYIGVHLDEAGGVNDGSFEGKKYFECPDKHGVFVKSGILRVAKEAGVLDPLKWSSHLGSDDGVRTRSQSMHLAKVQPEPAPRSVIPTAAMSQNLQQAKAQSGPVSQSAVSTAVVPVGAAGSNAGGMQPLAPSPSRLLSAIADNLIQLGAADVLVPQGGVVPAAAVADNANVMQADISTVVAGVAGVGSNTGMQIAAAVQPSARLPMPEGSFSAAEEEEIKFFVEKLQSVVSLLSDALVDSMRTLEQSKMSLAAKKKVLSIVGDKLSERAQTFKLFSDQYGSGGFAAPPAQSLAAAGQQLRDIVEKLQGGVVDSLSNINAAEGTMEQKKQQTMASVNTMNKIIKQIKRSFRPIELNAPSACVSDVSSVTSTTSASAKVVPKGVIGSASAPVRRVESNRNVSLTNGSKKSAGKKVPLAGIRVAVDAKSVVVPADNQVGHGMVNGGLGVASRSRGGAPVAKNNPARDGVLNGGAGGVDRNADRNGFGGNCYNCHQHGHLARDCSSDGGAGAASRNANRNGSGGDCYNCEQPGHFARNCPSASAVLRVGNCYNCGQPGHLARNCSSDSARPRVGNCYNCNQSGHWARDCRNTSGEPRGGNDRHTVEHRRRDTTPAQPRESEDVTAQLRRAKWENAKLKRDLEASERARNH